MPQPTINPRIVAGRPGRPGPPGDKPSTIEVGELWAHRCAGTWEQARQCRVVTVAGGVVAFQTTVARRVFEVPLERVLATMHWRRLSAAESVEGKEASE